MKYVYLLLIVVISTFTIQAQNIARAKKSSGLNNSIVNQRNINCSERINTTNQLLNPEQRKHKNKLYNSQNEKQDLILQSGKKSSQSKNQLRSSTAIIWSDDFSNATNWTVGNLAGNTQNWVIGTNGPVGTYSSQIGSIASTTAANGFAMYDSDGMGSGSSLPGDQNAFVRTANSIDLTGHPFVKIRFEQLYRKLNSQTFIGVKVGLANWVEIEVNTNLNNGDFGINIIEADISAIAGNQSDVKIYFRYYGTWDYVWMVDDVSIEDAFINDAATHFVYALGEQPIGISDNISAIVQNTGAGNIANLNVTLSITGANTFTNIQTIPSLLVGETTIVTFDNYIPTNTGLNDITVSVNNDNNNSNNSYSYYHETGTTFAFADTSNLNQGLGYNTGDGLVLCKYWAESSTAVADIDVYIADDINNPGNTIYAVVLDSIGNIVGTSGNLVITSGHLNTWQNFTIPIQPLFNNSDFYVGIAQTANAVTGYFPVGTQAETYLRDNAYFISNIDGTGLQEANTFGRFMIKANLGNGISYDVGVLGVVSPNNNSGCGLSNNESVTVRIENFGLQDISNFPVSFSINGGSVFTETVTTTILSGSYYDHTFSNTVDLSSYQMYDFISFTGLTNDEYTGNDTLITTITSGDAVISVEILTDNWGEETLWGIFNNVGELIYSDGIYDDTTLYEIDVCVLSGDCYSFVIIDDYGDGIVSPGYYQVSYNNVIVGGNTGFNGNQDWIFNIGGGCPANELGVDMVYTLGKLPKNQGSPHIITALIYNYGTASQSNVSVSLNISGDNSFSDIQIIPLIQSGESIYVEFSAFTPTSIGTNDITVSLPTDEDITNNSYSQNQEVNQLTFSYADTSAVVGNVGYFTNEGLLFNKHYMNGGGQIVQVGFMISADVNTEGNTIYAVVLDSDTNIVAQSANYIIQNSDLDNMLTLDLITPVSFSNETFFIGLAQTANTSSGYYPLSTQHEDFTRSATYFGSNINGQNIVEYTNLGRFYIEAILSHGPNWDFTNTGSNHTILIPDVIEVSIDGTQIDQGDYIGIFYDQNGALACGGYVMYTGTIDAIAAWGAQAGSDDGFQSGESFSWKIWDATDGIIYDALAVYNYLDFPNEDFYITNGMSGLASLIATTTESHSIDLVQGWGIFSTYINPFEPNLDSIFSSIVGNIEIVKDGNGFVYWPQWGVNGIGDLTIGEGYQINSITNLTLIIDGVSVIPENTPISLPAGWSIIGYLRDTPMDIAAVMLPIMNNVVIMKNGGGYVYWPQYGVNGIGNMNPGEGYQINMTMALNFTFPANTLSYSKIVNPVIHNSNFDINTGNNMTVGFPSFSLPTSLKPGDIILAYNKEGLKVGEAKVSSHNIALTVWGDDNLTNIKDGMHIGEQIIFKAITESKIIEFEVIDWISGNEEYSTNGISVAKSIKINDNAILNQNYPNPVSSVTEISFFIPSPSFVEIELIDAKGDVIDIITYTNYPSGLNSIYYNTSSLPDGTYFYRLLSDSFINTKSMIIKH